MSIYECKVCDRICNSPRSIAQHISSHGYNSKSYYDTFIKKESEGSCMICEKETRWTNINQGYVKKCHSCASKESAIKQWSGKIGEKRKQNLSIKMTGNSISVGRPKNSKNKNKYPEGVASTRALLQFEKYGHNWSGKKHTIKTKQKMSETAIKRIEQGIMPRTSYKGKFNPKNPQKYAGNLDNIIWRSTYELKVMKYLDENSNVVEWSSEEIVIPYKDPTQNKWRRYFPDFLAKIRRPDGSIQTLMLEVKPYEQTKEPKVQKKRTKKYITEVTTWAVNDAKWKAARELCADKGWEFRLITEKEIFGKNK